MHLGKKMLGHGQVQPGVASSLHEVQIEGTFPDGTKLVTVHDPISDVRTRPAWLPLGTAMATQSCVCFILIQRMCYAIY
jgi:Urease, gamma subunit